MDENDIFQLTGSPSAGVSELDIRYLISPNPVSAGQLITLELNKNMTGQLHTASGQLVQTLELQTSKNQISTSGLLSGVYFLRLNKEVIRVVVN